jgi:hypothetical protein
VRISFEESEENIMPGCTCDNSEAEDDRAAVLRCSVHGPKTFWRPTGDERTDEAVRAVIVAAWEQLGND